MIQYFSDRLKSKAGVSMTQWYILGVSRINSLNKKKNPGWFAFDKNKMTLVHMFAALQNSCQITCGQMVQTLFFFYASLSI